MWKNLVLYHLLHITTNSGGSCDKGAKYFNCFPHIERDSSEPYETVHYFGHLVKKGDVWCVQNGFEQVPINITSETVGFRTIKYLTESVHVFAAVPVPDHDAEYANFIEEGEIWEVPTAMLITTDDIYQMAYAVDSIRDKHRVLSDFYFLPMDQKTTVYRFMVNEVFAKNMARCLGFMASARIDPYFYSDRNDDLIEQYNEIAESGNKIDMYRIFSFLDIVGDELLLSENSASIHFPPTWLSFLACYALAEGCSVWSIPDKSLTQTILKEVPHNFFVPTDMLCWILDSAQQNEMIKTLLKCKNRKKGDEIRTRLLHFLSYGSAFNLTVIHSILRHLMNTGLTDMELDSLLSGNSAAVVKNFLRSEYGMKTI